MAASGQSKLTGAGVIIYENYYVNSVTNLKGPAVILFRNKHTGRYEDPGGNLDPGETPKQAAVRELAEESLGTFKLPMTVLKDQWSIRHINYMGYFVNVAGYIKTDSYADNHRLAKNMFEPLNSANEHLLETTDMQRFFVKDLLRDMKNAGADGSFFTTTASGTPPKANVHILGRTKGLIRKADVEGFFDNEDFTGTPVRAVPFKGFTFQSGDVYGRAGLVSDSAVEQALVESKGDVNKAIEALSGARTKASAMKDREERERKKLEQLGTGGSNDGTGKISRSARRTQNTRGTKKFVKQFEDLSLTPFGPPAPYEPKAGPRPKPSAKMPGSKELSTRVTKEKRLSVNNTGKERRVIQGNKVYSQGMGPDAGSPKPVTSLPIFRQRWKTVLTTVDADGTPFITPCRKSTFAGFSSDPAARREAKEFVDSVMCLRRNAESSSSSSDDDTETDEESEKGAVGVLKTIRDESERREHRLLRNLQNDVASYMTRNRAESEKYDADMKRERATRIQRALPPRPDVDLTGQPAPPVDPVFRSRMGHGERVSLDSDDDDWKNGQRVNEMASARTRESVRTKW
jgi:ADP-ribose pyrophosphatase YjhB (NUDIX family)